MNVNIISTGKLKENYLRLACGEYTKRLQSYCRLKIIELPESRLSGSPSEKEIKAALLNEAKLIIPLLLGNECYNITMCIEGGRLSSKGFAEKIMKIAVEGKSTLNIVIGSSYGLHEDVKKISHFKLSVSEMTFPHQLFRVMVLEQVYRAFHIINNGKYHK